MTEWPCKAYATPALLQPAAPHEASLKYPRAALSFQNLNLSGHKPHPIKMLEWEGTNKNTVNRVDNSTKQPHTNGYTKPLLAHV